MASPDVRRFVNLTLFDRDPLSIFTLAIGALQARYPEWTPYENSTEVTLLQGLAVEASEVIFATNRTPAKMTEVLLRLFGLVPDPGQPATADVKFITSDTTGHTIPAGTRVRLNFGGDAPPCDFLTNDTLTIAAGSNNGTIAATADESGTRPHSAPIGFELELVDAIFYVDTVEFASVPTGGTNPESDIDFLDRGINQLARLVTTLVHPEHFTAAALDDSRVARATTINAYNPDLHNEKQTVTITGTPTGGNFQLTIPGVTGGGPTANIAYNATAAQVQAALEALAGVAPGDVYVTGGPGPGTAFTVEFRRAFAAQNISQMTATHTLTGGTTPGVTVATTQAGNATSGADGGHVTVAVAGPAGATLTPAVRAEIETALAALAQANLSVHVIDPTLTTVTVAVTVVGADGYADATVEANVEAAITSYLSADEWAWGGTVYANEIEYVARSAEGVLRVVSVTITGGSPDLVLPGLAPLAVAGTITATVT